MSELVDNTIDKIKVLNPYATRCVRLGKNDLQTKAPWIIPYLKDPEDVFRYTYMSNEKIWFKCPICSTEYYKPVYRAVRSRFQCKCCSDGISYPNKFIRSLLLQFPINDFEPEFYRPWTNGFYYDNYFTYKNIKYFVEADGAYHYLDTNRTTAQQIKNIDALKDEIATNHNIKMIRINCKKQYATFLKNSVVNSALSEIFDLSIIDWEKCHKDAMKNIAYEVCMEYNKEQKTLKEIAKYFHISYHSARKYKKQGLEAGIVIPISSKTRANNIAKQRRENIGAVYSLDNKLLFEFTKFEEAVDKLNNIDLTINAILGSLWYCANRSKNHIYKEKYIIKVFQKGLNYEQSYEKVS